MSGPRTGRFRTRPARVESGLIEERDMHAQGCAATDSSFGFSWSSCRFLWQGLLATGCTDGVGLQEGTLISPLALW